MLSWNAPIETLDASAENSISIMFSQLAALGVK